METRVEKYKEYRTSLIKDGALSSMDFSGEEDDSLSTTTTLPLDEVLQNYDAQEEEEEIRIQTENEKNKYKAIMVSAICGAVVLVAITVVLGILAWK